MNNWKQRTDNIMPIGIYYTYYIYSNEMRTTTQRDKDSLIKLRYSLFEGPMWQKAVFISLYTPFKKFCKSLYHLHLKLRSVVCLTLRGRFRVPARLRPTYPPHASTYKDYYWKLIIILL